jgi:hypothetical protein
MTVPAGFADIAGDVAGEMNANCLQFRRTTVDLSKKILLEQVEQDQ